MRKPDTFSSLSMCAKLLSPYILSLFVISCFCLSCNTNKKNTATEDHPMIVTLVKKQSENYITDHYKKYSPSNIGLSNKTLNQYRIIFTCNDKEYNTLKEELANDSNILNFSDQLNSDDRMQGKNTKRAKTKSIRDKN